MNWGCYFNGDIEIGMGCLIGPMVIATSTSHPCRDTRHIKDLKFTSEKIIIGDGVFIGAGAIILAGCVIGNGAVIGAGSVLTPRTVVGENEIWVGNPCRFKKKRIPYEPPPVV